MTGPRPLAPVRLSGLHLLMVLAWAVCGGGSRLLAAPVDPCTSAMAATSGVENLRPTGHVRAIVEDRSRAAGAATATRAPGTLTVSSPGTYELQFTAQPTTVVAPAAFATTITVIDVLTGLPVTPSGPITITLATQGTGRLLGTTILVTSTMNTTFTALRYQGVETTTLSASSPGMPVAVSGPIDFDEPVMQVAHPALQPVNTPFDLQLSFWSALFPAQPLAVTSLPVTVQALGSGTLTGAGIHKVQGSTPLLSGMAYDAWGTLQIKLSTPYSVVAISMVMTVDLTVPAATLYVAPSLPQPVTVTVRDGNGDPLVVDQTFDWLVTNSSSIVAQGSVPVVAGSSFVVPVPALPVADHDLTVVATVGAATPLMLPIRSATDAPGPVLQLRPGRVGTPYVDTLAGVVTGVPVSYAIGYGTLPDGLTLNPVSGAVSGTPTVAGTVRLQAVVAVGATWKPIRVTLSVFSADESEIVSGQNFGFTGATPPYTATQQNEVLAPGSTFDNGNPTFQIRVHYPTQVASITQPMPLLVHHHGRGFDHTEYNDVLGRIARWGVVCVSSGDYYSFFGNTQPGLSGSQPYETPTQRAEAGMESAAGTQERLLRRMIVRNRTPGDVLFGKIDEARLFISGHSRGGGAIHAGQSRGFAYKLAASAPQIPAIETVGIAGYIGLMPFDLWYFTACQPPSVPTVPGGLGAMPYNIPRDQRRIPGLVFASELDGDLSYPICDQMGERRTTSTCFLTIWGGNHNNTGDAHFAEASTSITALTQRNILVQWMTAFLLRFGYDRLDLDGHLFGAEHAQSSHVGRVAYRDMSSPIMILDAQNGNVALNSLALPNVVSAGLTASLVNPYPTIGALANATPRSLRLLFSTIGAGKTFRTTVSSIGMNVQDRKRLVFEVRQSGTTGFNWLSIGVRLTDISGATTLVSVYDRVPVPDVSTFLPIHPIPGHTSARPLNRFLQVEIPLSQFPGVDLTQLASVEFEFDNSSTTLQLMIDDLRIE